MCGEAGAADADAEAAPLHGHNARRDEQLVHLVEAQVVVPQREVVDCGCTADEQDEQQELRCER